MIRVDVLQVLLVLEFTAFCIVLSLFLFCRNRKHKRLYQKALGDMVSLKITSAAPSSHKQGGGEAAASKKAADNARYEEVLKEKKLLANKIAELTAQMEEENKRMAALQSKYATLEKEYSVLYGKHFEGKK